MMITGQLPMYSKGFTTTAETVSCNLTIRETKKQGDQKQQFVGYPRREVVINFFCAVDFERRLGRGLVT